MKMYIQILSILPLISLTCALAIPIPDADLSNGSGVAASGSDIAKRGGASDAVGTLVEGVKAITGVGKGVDPLTLAGAIA